MGQLDRHQNGWPEANPFHLREPEDQLRRRIHHFRLGFRARPGHQWTGIPDYAVECQDSGRATIGILCQD